MKGAGEVMLRGDAVTTGKWVVLFNFWWKSDYNTKSKKIEEVWLRALANFETEMEAQKFYDYCEQKDLVPTKRPRYNRMEG